MSAATATHAPARAAADPLAMAERLRPQIDAARSEGDRTRRLPSGLLEHLRAAGAFDLWTPVELGGLEGDMVTVLRVLEEFARIDGAVAWNVWNGNLGFSAALLGEEAVRTIWPGGRSPVICNSARVTGSATPAHDGALSLSGRWDIVSAVDAADWAALFAIVMDGDAPRMGPYGPDVRVFYLPASDITVLDTWHTTGMRGTGSNSVVVDAVTVPEHLTTSPFAPGRIDRPLYRIPAFTLASCGSAAAVLGMAQAALDAVAALAEHKVTDDGRPLRQRAHAQSAIAGADAALAAARLLLHGTAADITSAADRRDPIDEARRGPFRSAMVHAARTARDTVNCMYELAGSAALRRGSDIDRIWRDTNAACQHALLQPVHHETAGRLLLGLDAGVPVF